jgi:hypothetical protein
MPCWAVPRRRPVPVCPENSNQLTCLTFILVMITLERWIVPYLCITHR